MPIWSFTQERLDRLKEQIVKKKEERDALAALSEKDLWCKDLDDFEAEWENQLRLDAEISTGIRRMGRRTSKKIGAGRGRKAKGADDEYAPVAKSKPGPKAAPKAAPKPKEPPKEKSVQRFAAMFNGGTKKTGLDGAADSDDDPFSDDDFSKLKNPAKKEQATAQDSDEEVQPAPRSRRAAASKAKAWIVDDDESESDDDKMLGDVGDLVKGITNNTSSASENKTGRLSLFSMSRPESSSGNSASLKVKSKPSKVMDLDDHDDTNYEMLAKSSPHKSARADELDSFLSDDDLPSFTKPVSKSKSSISQSEEPEPKAKAAATKEPAVKGRRGRTAVAKSKAKEEKPARKAAAPKAASKAVNLSPAAKAYAAKKEKAKPKRDVFDMDDDEDDELELDEPASPPPRPVARGRPGRAAAAKSKPIYIIDDDEEEEEDELELANNDDEEEQSDDFAMDDSE